MIKLAPVDLKQISSWFEDFKKKAKGFELPKQGAEYIGIFHNEELIGYFILVTYKTGILEINQGYLKPEARHKNFSRISMSLLEEKARNVGIKKIMLGTDRAVGSYIRFMRSMGFDIETAIFAKELK